MKRYLLLHLMSFSRRLANLMKYIATVNLTVLMAMELRHNHKVNLSYAFGNRPRRDGTGPTTQLPCIAGPVRQLLQHFHRLHFPEDVAMSATLTAACFI